VVCDERDQILADRAGRDVREDVAQLANQPVLALGVAQVAALDVVPDLEARKRTATGGERANGLDAVLLHQCRRVAACRK